MVELLSYTIPAKTLNLANKEIIKIIFDRFSSLNIKLLGLRYLLEAKVDHSFIYEKAVELLTRYSTSMLTGIQLISIVEITSDSVFAQDSTLHTLKKKQVTYVMSLCYAAQVELWRSILHSSKSEILHYAYILNNEIKNATNFFKQMNINEKSEEQYGQQYVNFITNITGNLEELQHYQDPEPKELSPIMLKVNRSSPNLLSSNKLSPLIQSYQSFDSTHLESFPQLSPLKKQINQVTPQRIALCKEANNFKMPGQVLNERISQAIFIFGLFLAFMIDVLVIVHCRHIFGLYSSTKTYITVQDMLFEESHQRLSLIIKQKKGEYNNLTYFIQLIQSLPEVAINIKLEYEKINNQYINSSIIENSLLCLYDFLNFYIMGEGSPMSFINLTSNYLFLANEMLDYSSYRMHDLDDIYNEFQLVTNLMIYIVTSILVIFLIIFFAISCKRSKDLQKLTEQSLLIPKNQVSTVLLNFMSLSEDSSISLLPLQASTDFIINIKIILTLIFIYFFQICLLLIIQLIFRNMAFVVKSTINDASAIPIIQTAYFTLCNFFIDLPSYDKVELLIVSMIDFLSQLDLESPFYSDNTSTVSNTSLSKVSLISLISINFTAIQSTSVFPFPDISLSSSFLIKMREIVFSLKEMSSIHQDKAIHNLSYAYLNLIFENTECFYDFGESLSAFFKLKYGIDVFTFFSILMAFSLVEVFLYIFSRGLIQDINKIVSLLCRLCSLLPDDSPFAQEPEEHEINHKNSRFWKDPPPSNLKHIFEALPIGIILTNKDGNIQKVNQLANEMYNNQAYKFGNIGNLSSELIINSHPRIYSLKQYDGKNLPTDEYGRSLEWESSKCYMVQNITKQINIHNHIQTLMIDINILHQSLIPPSIRALTEKIMILGQFIIVNISLTPDFPDVRFEVFEKNYLKTCERFSMILTSDIKRFDIHTLFSSVSTKGNSRQYIREAYIFVQKMCKLLGGDAKISMISGHKCICEIDDSDKENFWLYSHSFIRASAMFRCCDYGEIVTEWNVLKTIPNSEKNIDRTGTVTLNNREYDYAILSQRLFG